MSGFRLYSTSDLKYESSGPILVKLSFPDLLACFASLVFKSGFEMIAGEDGSLIEYDLQ